MGGEAPGFAEVMRHFSWDVPWLAALAGISAIYLWGVVRARRAGRIHPLWKVIAFHLGLFVTWVGVLTPLEHYGNQVLWINFLGFLVITMIAGPLLVLGSPLTLAFRASGKAGRRRLRRFYRSAPVVVLTFPIASGLIFAVVTYVWQFSGLTGAAAENVYVRDIQLATLLLVAVIFWTPALCADPLRWRTPYPLRALYVFVEMVHKALFGGMFLSASTPFHEEFAARAPAWAPSPMTDQAMAILVLWIGGNLIFLVALAGIIQKWLAYEGRNQVRVDRRLERARREEQRRRAALDQVFQKTV